MNFLTSLTIVHMKKVFWFNINFLMVVQFYSMQQITC